MSDAEAGAPARPSNGPSPEPDHPQPQRSARELAFAAAMPDEAETAAETVVKAPDQSLLEHNDTPRWSPQEIFDASPLSEWFPGVAWRTVMVWLGGIVFQSEDSDPITLLVETGDTTPAGVIRYTRADPWVHGVVGWFGPEITSMAELGELLTEESQAPGSPR